MHVASVNYDTKRVFLHADTVVNGFDAIAAYFEINTLRAANAAGEQNRKHCMSAEGNIAKTLTTFTPRYGYIEPGWRFVPHDTGVGQSYNLDLLAEIVSKDQLTDRDVFDRSGVACTVNIDPVYEKVEIRVVTTGGSALTTEEHNKLMAVPAAVDNAGAILAAAQITPIQSISQDRIIEGALTEGGAYRIMLSALAGKVAKSGTNIKFKSVDGLIDRIDGTVDDLGNRTAVALNGG